jgi:hypothetical protein
MFQRVFPLLYLLVSVETNRDRVAIISDRLAFQFTERKNIIVAPRESNARAIAVR